jgi:hypothetical protein
MRDIELERERRISRSTVPSVGGGVTPNLGWGVVTQGQQG